MGPPYKFFLLIFYTKIRYCQTHYYDLVGFFRDNHILSQLCLVKSHILNDIVGIFIHTFKCWF